MNFMSCKGCKTDNVRRIEWVWNLRGKKIRCNTPTEWLTGMKQFSCNASDISGDALELQLIQASKIKIKIKYVINELKTSTYKYSITTAKAHKWLKRPPVSLMCYPHGKAISQTLIFSAPAINLLEDQNISLVHYLQIGFFHVLVLKLILFDLTLWRNS